MTRSKAIVKVKKLLALARDRAATEPERRLANEKAQQLIERFEMSNAEIAPDPPRRPLPPRPQPMQPSGPVVIIVSGTFTGTTSTTSGNWAWNTR